MSEPNGFKVLYVHIPVELHVKLKALAVKKKTTVKALVTSLIEKAGGHG